MVKVALTYIVKDNSQAKILEKSLKSFTKYFDGLYVLVNGPSGHHDEIHKLVKKFGGTSISVDPKSQPNLYTRQDNGTYKFTNFGLARNLNFAMVPASYDYISWADTDDILIGGEQLKLIAEQAKQKNMDMTFMTYAYVNKFDDFGNLLEIHVPHQRERLIANNGKFEWKKRLHETVLPKDDNQRYTTENYTHGKDGTEIAWVHTASKESDKESQERNAYILRIQAEEEEYKDPRTIFYLGKTHFDMKTPEDFDKAEQFFRMYVPMSGWDGEISQAYEFIGLIRTYYQDPKGAAEAYFNALKHNPISHTANLKLADALATQGKIQEAKHFLKAYENLPEMTSSSLVTSIKETKALYATVQFNISHKEGKIKDAIKWAEERSKYIEDDLLEQIKFHDEIENLAKAYLTIATAFVKGGKFDYLAQFVDTAPPSLQKEEFMKKVMNSFPPKKWEDKTIVYFASFYEPHFEEWNGDSIKTGIGGSESAVIYLAEQWVKNGYKVVVYCDTPTDIVINGVEYIKYWKINWKDEFDTFILWRMAQMLDLPITAKRLFLDMHDVAYHQVFTDYRISRVDKVFFKSRAHRGQVPQLPDDKAVVISNGIVL